MLATVSRLWSGLLRTLHGFWVLARTTWASTREPPSPSVVFSSSLSSLPKPPLPQQSPLASEPSGSPSDSDPSRPYPVLYISRISGDSRADRLSPLSFANNDVAIQFMKDLRPIDGQIYTLMLPDGLDARGFVNWKSIIKRGGSYEVRD